MAGPDDLSDLGAVPLDTVNASRDPAQDNMLDLGARPLTKDEITEIEQRQKYDSPVLASIAGAARGASLGLSDVAAGAFGLDEDLANLKKYNPTASTVGEIAGGVGGAFLGPGALVAKGAAAATKGVASRVLAKAGAAALEGAAYGAGQTVSDVALDQREIEPAEVAESLLANVGIGALFGGGFSLAGSGVEASAKGLSGQVKKFLERGGDVEVSPFKHVEDVFDAERAVEKPNLGAIRQAENELQVQLPEYVKNGSPILQGTASSLEQSPTLAGSAIRNELDTARAGVQRATSDVLSEGTKRSEREIGDEIKSGFMSEIHQKLDPLSAAFDELKASTKNIALSDTAVNGIKRSFQSEDFVRLFPSSAPTSEAKGFIQALEDGLVKNVDDVSQYRSRYLSQSRAAFRAGNTQEGQAFSSLARSLENLENRTIRRAAIDQAGKDGAEAAADTIAEMRETRSKYRAFKELLSDVASEGGLGKVRSTSQLLDKLEEMPSEKLVRKLFDVRNSRGLEFFKREFPEQFELMRINYIGNLRDGAIKEHPIYGQIFDVPKIIRETKKLSPEARTLIFGQAGTRALKNIEVIQGAFPKLMGPSGTAQAIEFQSILSPLLHVRDGARLMLLKGMPIAQRAIEKQDKAIGSHIKGFLSTSGKAISVGAVLSGLELTKDDYSKRIDNLADLASNPENLVSKLSESTRGLASQSPDVHQAMLNSSIEAVQFLQAKAPKNPFTTEVFGKSKWRPSDTELSKWNRYVKAADDPMSVLEDLNARVLTPEAVETVRTLYPTLYKKITERVINGVSAHKAELPYADKMQLSLLLGMPVTGTINPSFIRSMQQASPTSQNSQPTPHPTKLTGDVARLAQTQTEKIALR